MKERLTAPGRGLQDEAGSAIGGLILVALYAVTLPYYWARGLVEKLS